MAKKTIAILGLGIFGSSLARSLAENGCDVIAIDIHYDNVDELADVIEHVVQADYTKYDQLVEANVGEANLAVIASSQRLEDTILAILNLQRLGIEEIIVKCKNNEYRDVLLKLGASRVILPEQEMGARIAHELINPTVHELINLDNRFNVIEFQAQPTWLGKSLADIDFRQRYATNIIAYKPITTDEYTIEFTPGQLISKGDVFIGMTTDAGLKGKIHELFADH